MIERHTGFEFPCPLCKKGSMRGFERDDGFEYFYCPSCLQMIVPKDHAVKVLGEKK